MRIEDIQIGMHVRTRVEFNGVPVGTQGVVDERYSFATGSAGFMVAWDLPDQPLPPNYREHDGMPAIVTRILRDGFDQSELHYLEAVE